MIQYMIRNPMAVFNSVMYVTVLGTGFFCIGLIIEETMKLFV